MKSFNKLLILFFLGIFLFNACTEDELEVAKPGSVVLEFDAVSGSSDLIMGTNYTNASGELFSVTMLQYYVSNIKLTAEDGTEYMVPASANSGYTLVKEDGEITLTDVPAGNYVSIEFVVGVDSLRSAMGPSEREGDLDIGDMETGGNMYWSWNSGYIFMRFEGIAPEVPDSTIGLWVQDTLGNWNYDTTQYTYWLDVFNIHVGGFGGYDASTVNNIRKVKLDFGSTKLIVKETAIPEVHITADVMKIMDGSVNHSFSNFYQEHSPDRTGTIADNYKNMFSVDHIHND